jgi:hypothetical protein
MLEDLRKAILIVPPFGTINETNNTPLAPFPPNTSHSLTAEIRRNRSSTSEHGPSAPLFSAKKLQLLHCVLAVVIPKVSVSGDNAGITMAYPFHNPRLWDA